MTGPALMSVREVADLLVCGEGDVHAMVQRGIVKAQVDGAWKVGIEAGSVEGLIHRAVDEYMTRLAGRIAAQERYGLGGWRP